MFNYIKETIINDVTNKVSAADGTLLVKRGGNYKFDQICDKKVFKRAGVAGTKAVLKVPFTATNGTYDYYQYLIFVDTPLKSLSDYALANWHEFGKPIVVESAAANKNDLVEAFKLALPLDNPFYTVVAGSGATADLTFAEPWMHVNELQIFKHNASTDKMEAVSVGARNTYVTTENVPEFATADWLVENLRFPSYYNLRYAHPYADESPVAGTIYNQYSFQYVVKHAVPGGVSAVGQNVDSITTHVFYVPSGSASAFETFFTNGGCSIVTDLVDASMDVNANAIAAVAAEAEAAKPAAKSGASDPTTATVGKVGDIYTNTTSDDVFTCTAVDTSGDTPSYTWVKTYDAA